MTKKYYLLLMLLLSGIRTIMAQPVAIFDRLETDLGTILWKMPVTVTFQVTNRGNEPLVITYADTDCGCTVAEWTQEPIAPKGTGKISATFDAGLLGKFQKSIGVYTNMNDTPIYLTLKGCVASRLENYEQTHPFQIGTVRIDCNDVAFPDAQQGEKPVAEIQIINTGESEYAPIMMHLPSYIEAKAIPDTLQRKQAGVLRLTLNTEKIPTPGLMTTSIYLARFPGDKVSKENEIRLSGIIIPDFSKMTTYQKAMAPALTLSSQTVRIAPFGNKKKQSFNILLTNNGKSTLKIEALHVSDTNLGVNLRKNKLGPGESCKMKVTINKEIANNKEGKAHLMMITNDPKNPKVIIEVVKE